MQRLFSTFPRSWPGIGLLLLRVTAGIPLILNGAAAPQGIPHLDLATAQWLSVAVGALLIAGLLTPVAGALLAIVELWMAAIRPGSAESHLMLGALGAGLAMLGPGAWSIDARRFGRRRISIPNQSDAAHPTRKRGHEA